jgi:hypothetical protein
MPWCPKCRMEYEVGVEECSDCKEKLIDQLEPLPAVEYGTEAFLINVADGMEVNIVETLLNSYDIPVRKKYRDPSGAYLSVYMGSASTGVDIYVPESKLNEAKEILKSEFESNSNNKSEDINEKPQIEKALKKRRIVTWILILILILPILLGLLLFAVKYIMK